MDLSSVLASPSYGKAAETYKKAVAAAATAATYTMVVRSMSKELFPDELRGAARWAASVVRARLLRSPKQRRTKTIFIGKEDNNRLYAAARSYLATRIDPHAATRHCLVVRGDAGAQQQVLSMVLGDPMTDVFEGVEFTWTMRVPWRRDDNLSDADDDDAQRAACSDSSSVLMSLRFDAEHTDLALGQYVPFIMAEAEMAQRQRRTLQIFINSDIWWRGITHRHPATFQTLAIDPKLKQSVIDDLDRFLKRKEHYRRIGKTWKRGYLLYGPPGTGKSSLVAAMANHLRFDLYDLDLSEVLSNSYLQKLLSRISDNSILVIEDIDCCFSTASRDKDKDQAGGGDDGSSPAPGNMKQKITLSGLLNFIDGLWTTSGEERIVIFTTNYKDRLDPALLRPGRMDVHIYMGYCGWEAFKTLANNYFLLDDHPLFGEIQGLLGELEVTPAEVSEMLLRSEDADVALQGFVQFLHNKKGDKP
ncbi:hypothetical protein QOZ80_7BG0601150 [Eleusine coracana subsp. coracana]|nr:hypothetical protein QOZ80_7BG0601150 [Eleusine coracana subsp. coracana]